MKLSIKNLAHLVYKQVLAEHSAPIKYNKNYYINNISNRLPKYHKQYINSFKERSEKPNFINSLFKYLPL